jgi:hypothetical protein
MREAFLNAQGHKTILKDGEPVSVRDMIFEARADNPDYKFMFYLLKALKVAMKEGHTEFDMGAGGVTYFTRFDA